MPDYSATIFDLHLERLLCMFCPGHARVKGNDRTERMAGKEADTNRSRLGRYEVLRSLRHFLRAHSQGHHVIDHLQERGVEERGRAARSSLKGHEGAIVSQTNI